MGGRGSGGGYSTMAMSAGGFATLTVNPAANTPSGRTLSDYQNMTDQEMHDFLIDVNDVDMPDFMSNLHTQKLIYSLGMNDKPEIVSESELQRRLANDPSIIPIYRSCRDTKVNGIDFSGDECLEMLTDGELTWVGEGIHGDGLYFSDSLAGSKCYGPRTVGGYLNQNARVISETRLSNLYDNWVGSHPASQRALGFAKSHSYHDSLSQFALSQGYNVITSGRPGRGNDCYYTVLDRSALTLSRKRRSRTDEL